jgi:hypothetical protein
VNVVFAHIAGVPVEETIGALGPAILVVFGAATVNLRSRWHARRNRG